MINGLRYYRREKRKSWSEREFDDFLSVFCFLAFFFVEGVRLFFGKPREKNTSTRTRKSQITCDMWKNEDIKEEEEEDNKEAQILTNEEERDDERRFFLLLRAADGEKTSFSS